MKNPPFKAALSILKKLQSEGHEAYFAGGCVRDYLIGLEPEDFDIATSARPRQVMRIFPKAVPVGIKFGVVTVVENDVPVEVATFRGESGYKDGRRPARVRWSDARRDVLRRDFTINGMLWNPLTNEVIDLVGGRRDLKEGIIRSIGAPEKRFSEDRLRMVRAVRFAARFSFRIDEETEKAIARHASKIRMVSKERLRDELNRILTSAGRGRAIENLSRLGLLKFLLPEIETLKGTLQGKALHPEGDAFRHTIAAMEFLKEPSVTLAWGTLLHDVGKAKARKTAKKGFARHEGIGEEATKEICRRFRFSNEETERITWLVSNHMYLLAARKMRPAKLKRLFSHPGFEELLRLHRADALAAGGSLVNYNFCQRKYFEFIEEGKTPPPLINGNDLIAMGLEPGPIFREILDAVQEEQLDGKVKTERSALLLARRIAERRGLLKKQGRRRRN